MSALLPVSLVSLALSDDAQVLTFGIPSYVDREGRDQENTGFISAKADTHSGSKVWKSGAIQLDVLSKSLISEEERVVFVKVDVEGFEFEAINGALATLQLYKPLIQTESNPNVMAAESTSQLFQALYALGYCSFCQGEFSQSTYK